MIAIIDYGLGNLASVKNALNKLGVDSVITSSSTEIQQSRGFILPGVGAAGTGMKNLKSLGLDKVIVEEVRKGKSILGICLGMQLLFSFSQEGNVTCLDVVPGKVKKFGPKVKVPQIGWNQVTIQTNAAQANDLFNTIPQNSSFYFVHSYYCEPIDKKIQTGTTKYGIDFCSVLQNKNIVGVQFHPEKSGDVGFTLLKNFIENYGN